MLSFIGYILLISHCNATLLELKVVVGVGLSFKLYWLDLFLFFATGSSSSSSSILFFFFLHFHFCHFLQHIFRLLHLLECHLGNFVSFSFSQDLFDGTHTFLYLWKSIRMRKDERVSSTELLFREEHVAFLVQDQPEPVQIVKALASQFTGVPRTTGRRFHAFFAAQGISKGVQQRGTCSSKVSRGGSRGNSSTATAACAGRIRSRKETERLRQRGSSRHRCTATTSTAAASG